MHHQSGDGTSDPLEAFRRLVLADPALQDRLGAIAAADAFLAEAMAVAAAHGLALDAAAVAAAIRPDPLGLNRWMPAPVTLDRWPAPGWLPARTVPDGEAPAFDWAWFGAYRLDRPFFEEAVRHAASRPLSQMFRTRTSLPALVGDARVGDAWAPAGFIHHMSRCGSTLVAQMLGADPANVVLSEPEPLDGVLRWVIEARPPLEVQIAALRGIVAALGRDALDGRSDARPRRVIVKLDSWHTAMLPLLRAAFPDTPWVFVYRNPIEVLVSHVRHRGPHTVPGMLPSGLFDVPDAETMDPERYAALVLAAFSGAVLDHWPVGGGMLVEYRELPGAAIDRIAGHFGLMPDAEARAAMLAASMRDAKAPDRRFSADTAEKRQAATPASRLAAETILDPVYERLERFRLAGTSR